MGKCNGHDITAGEVAGSHCGHYVSKIAVQTALELGWEDDDAQGAVDTYDDDYAEINWPYFDSWFGIVDDAERWLNEHSDGLLWYFYDGSFHVDETGECLSCGCQRFTNPAFEDDDCANGHLWVEC